MATQALAPQIQEESKKTFAMDDPLTIKDQLILSPGVWNGTEFTEENINSALQNTDLSDTGVLNLYLDHQDTENPTPKAVGNWAGFVRNLRYVEGQGLFGDLEIWHPMAEQWKKARPKFGVSATLAGPGGEQEDIREFRIESASIVHDPACKPALLNLSKDPLKEMRNVTSFETVREKMGMSVEEFYALPKDPPSESKLPIFDAEHVRNAMARFNQTSFESEEEARKAKEKIMNKANKFDIKVDEFEKVGPELSKHKDKKDDEEDKKKKSKKMEEESEGEEENKEQVETDKESEDEEKTEDNSEELSQSEDSSPSENDEEQLKGGENDRMTEEQKTEGQPSQESSGKVEELESKVDKLADSVQKLAEIQKENLNSQEESKEEEKKESESQEPSEQTQNNSEDQKDKEIQELKEKVSKLENKPEESEEPKSKTLSASQESNEQNTNKLKNFSASKQMTNYLAKRIGA